MACKELLSRQGQAVALVLTAAGVWALIALNLQQQQQQPLHAKVSLHSSSKPPECSAELKPMQQSCDYLEKEEVHENVMKQRQEYGKYQAAIDGWVPGSHLGIVNGLSHFQHRQCVLGAVGEIGVHHGKFFYNMAASTLPEEPRLAMDLFDMQDLNFDGSGGLGKEKLDEFTKHGKALGFDESKVTIVSADSRDLTPSNFTDLGMPAFRFFSVDAGHAFENTLNDMRLAACVLHPKGVFVVDDAFNRNWAGVGEAIITFIHTTTRAAPFLWVDNKMYFTTAEAHPSFLDYIRTYPALNCTSAKPHRPGFPLHPSTYSMGGWEICIV